MNKSKGLTSISRSVGHHLLKFVHGICWSPLLVHPVPSFNHFLAFFYFIRPVPYPDSFSTFSIHFTMQTLRKAFVVVGKENGEETMAFCKVNDIIWLFSSCCLESKDLVLELADGTGLFEAKALGGLLQTANHGRRTAEQDLDVVGGLGEEFLAQMLVMLRSLQKIFTGWVL